MAERSGRVEIRCAGCGYGGVVVRLPDRCPMCGGCRWQRIKSTPAARWWGAAAALTTPTEQPAISSRADST
jgi:hypothetical protein